MFGLKFRFAHVMISRALRDSTIFFYKIFRMPNEDDAKLCAFMYQAHVDERIMKRIGAFCGFERPTNNMISGLAGKWCVGLKLITEHLFREFIRVSHQESYLVPMPYHPQVRSVVYMATYFWLNLRPMHISANKELQEDKVVRLLKNFRE